MNEKRTILEYDFKNEKQEFIDELLKNCYVDKKSRQLHCKICGNLIEIDWLRNLAFCGFHVISMRGVEYREVSYEISL
jgi:hypothetical protein